jgi:hypothetical protein
VSICQSVGLTKVARLEQSRRYLLTSAAPLSDEEKKRFASLVRCASVPRPLAPCIALPPLLFQAASGLGTTTCLCLLGLNQQPTKPTPNRHPPPQVHDRMTEEVYAQPVKSFAVTTPPAKTLSVPVLAHGRAALENINKVRADGMGWPRCLSVHPVCMPCCPAVWLTHPSHLPLIISTNQPNHQPVHLLPPPGDGPRL